MEGLPERQHFKGPLKRGVQLCKRNRDIRFAGQDSSLAPISIIITTLLGWSFEECVRSREYDHDLDLLVDAVKGMPNFIRTTHVAGQKVYVIPNETTAGENFAEKWNKDPRRAEAFYEWHKDLADNLESFLVAEGEDSVSPPLSRAFGSAEVHCQHLLWSVRMRLPYQPPGLTAAQQYRVLRTANPFGGHGRLSCGSLVWFYSVRPSAVGRLYALVLKFQQGEFPQVIVKSPDLNALAGGKDLPHVYEQVPPRLCLFLPWTGEWNPQRTLVETMLPWSVLWLYFFESWLRSGEWAGGGMHPAASLGRERSLRSMAAE
jgi:hypothetical protein